MRVDGHDSLFNDILGKTVTRNFVAEKLKLLVLHAGLDPSRYNTHSLRIGRATDLAKAGVPEAIIQQTGRWESDAYKHTSASPPSRFQNSPLGRELGNRQLSPSLSGGFVSQRAQI